MTKIANHREMTEKDILRKLNSYGVCAEIRPPYFGKTFGAVKLANENYKHVLYLYPTQAIRDGVISQICNYYGYGTNSNDEHYARATKKNTIEKFDFMTYMKLIKVSEEKMKAMDYDLIIIDEMHCIGAKCTAEALKMLRECNPNTHILGMTATPDRTDAIDVIDKFFDNIVAYPYTLHDAISDGLIKKPYYVYSTYNPVEQITQEILDEWKNKSWKATSGDIKLLSQSALEIANLYNLPNVIKGVCTEAKETDYLKFICFFDNFKHIKKRQEEVINWYQEAFPNHKVNHIIITSEDRVTQANINKLNTLTYKENTIDLIFCVNMLNVGYHVDDLTGILMYRCTTSNIIYVQQLGRALFSNKHGIIIDVVNNIERKALYDNYYRDDEVSYANRMKNEQIANGTWSDTYTVTNNEGEEIELDKSLRYDKETGEIRTKWHRYASLPQKEDYIIAGIEADRKKIEKKVIAESFVQVAHKVLLNYFKIWCNEVVHIPFPISFKQMQIAYGYKREEFVEWFDGILENEDISFPYHTLKNLVDGDKLFEEVCKVFSHTSRVNMEEVCTYYAGN